MILSIGTTVRAQSDLRDNIVKQVGSMESIYCINYGVKASYLSTFLNFGGHKSFL